VYISILFISNITSGQENKDNNNPNHYLSNELDSYFNTLIKSQQYVAFGAALIKNNKVVWEGYYGYSDLEKKTPLGRENIFALMSLSKTVTTFALMTLYEKGLFSLDDDINNYLPVKVRNPNFPEIPITFRMLLTHTASFEDVLSTGLKVPKNVERPRSSLGDSKMTLEEYIHEMLSPDGKYYSSEYFSQNKPGTKYSYSNIAFALLGYLVEKIAREDFSKYCKEKIFDSLEMKNTSWHLRGLDTSKVIFGYNFSPEDSIPNYKKIEHFGEPGYPTGMLRTTMEDFAKFINVIMNNGCYKNTQLLKPETIELMLSPQKVKDIPSRSFKAIDISLCWLINELENNELYNMNGFGPSAFINAYFSKKDSTAIIYYFTGINMKNMAAIPEITLRLHHALKSIE
jgi:CubicO group peptidase (beta-lactamase class C family)